MGQIYFRQDIADVLQSIACANEHAHAFSATLGDADTQQALLDAYRRGACATLLSVGLAFGLEPVGPGTQVRPGADPPVAGLLWAEIPRD